MNQTATSLPETPTPPPVAGALHTESEIAGKLLVASHALSETPLAGAVFLVCTHTAVNAVAFRLDEEAESPDFASLLRHLGVEPSPPNRVVPIVSGGPFEGQRGIVIHTPDWCDGQSQMLPGGGQMLCPSLAVLQSLAEGAGPRRALLAMGRAAWGPGHLDREIVSNVWLVAPADEEVVFDTDYKTKWRRALASLGVDPARLSSSAGNA